MALPCAPARPVSVLHVHGTADETVPYSVAGPSVAQWGGLDGCDTLAPGPGLDLDIGLAGAETRTESTTACPPGVAGELWMIEGGCHVPSLGDAFLPNAWRWLRYHRR